MGMGMYSVGKLHHVHHYLQKFVGYKRAGTLGGREYCFNCMLCDQFYSSRLCTGMDGAHTSLHA